MVADSKAVPVRKKSLSITPSVLRPTISCHLNRLPQPSGQVPELNPQFVYDTQLVTTEVEEVAQQGWHVLSHGGFAGVTARPENHAEGQGF